MPAVLTHDFFGHDAYGPALGAIGLYTPDERDAFLLGNQGPDPLFYLAIVPPLQAFEQLGKDMHHLPPAGLFVSLRKAVDALPESDRGAGRAYLAGFTCHYLLDRAVHPLVVYWERGLCQAGVPGLDITDAAIVHAEIERDLDEMVLYTKRNQTVEAYRPYEHVLRARDELLDVLGRVYFDAIIGQMAEGEPSTRQVFPIAVRCFRVSQQMLWSPKGRRTAVLAGFETRFGHQRYSLVRAMSHRVRAQTTSDFDNQDHRVWHNPFTNVPSTDSFWDIYNRTLRQVEQSIATVLADDFDEDAALTFTQGLNFSGEPVA